MEQLQFTHRTKVGQFQNKDKIIVFDQVCPTRKVEGRRRLLGTKSAALITLDHPPIHYLQAQTSIILT